MTVLLYCWHSYATEAPQALYFIAMNYAVHAVMYGYYMLMALALKPAWLPPVVVTLLQLAQMVVGVAVQAAAMRAHARDPAGCPHLHKQNLVAGALMCGVGAGGGGGGCFEFARALRSRAAVRADTPMKLRPPSPVSPALPPLRPSHPGTARTSRSSSSSSSSASPAPRRRAAAARGRRNRRARRQARRRL